MIWVVVCSRICGCFRLFHTHAPKNNGKMMYWVHFAGLNGNIGESVSSHIFGGEIYTQLPNIEHTHLSLCLSYKIGNENKTCVYHSQLSYRQWANGINNVRMHYNVNCCFSSLLVPHPLLVVVLCFFFFLVGWLVDSQITALGCVICRMQMKTKLLLLFIYLWGFYRFSFIEYVYYRIMHSDLPLSDASSFHFDIHTLLVLMVKMLLLVLLLWTIYLLIKLDLLDVTFVRRWPQNTIEYIIFHFHFKMPTSIVSMRKNW